jgi:hypothetical protein
VITVEGHAGKKAFDGAKIILYCLKGLKDFANMIGDRWGVTTQTSFVHYGEGARAELVGGVELKSTSFYFPFVDAAKRT